MQYIFNVTLNNIEIKPKYLNSGTFVALTFRCNDSPHHWETQSVSINSKIEFNYPMQFVITTKDINSAYFCISFVVFNDSRPSPIGRTKTRIGRIPIDSESNKSFSVSIMSTQKESEVACVALFSGSLAKAQVPINPNGYPNSVESPMAPNPYPNSYQFNVPPNAYPNSVQSNMYYNYQPKYQQQIPLMNASSAYQSAQTIPYPGQNPTTGGIYQSPLSQTYNAPMPNPIQNSQQVIPQPVNPVAAEDPQKAPPQDPNISAPIQEFHIRGHQYYF